MRRSKGFRPKKGKSYPKKRGVKRVMGYKKGRGGIRL